MGKWLIGAALAVVCAAATVFAQPAPGVAPSAALAQHAASRFLGRWVGTGWMVDQTGTRHTYEAHERARWNLAGTAIVIEGLGVARGEDGAVTIGHDAMAVIRLDEATGDVVFIAGREGDFARHALEVIDAEAGVMRWSPGGPVRFTIRITADRWEETGEFSRDGGETWTAFLGMTLERRDDLE
ncbi:MAG: hypothetical protein ACF8QF_05315 [Phycisphaerales bacterium]